MLLADRYRIVTPIGKGGMGEVYRAEDLRLGQTVALKFLPDTASSNPAAWANMEREVRIARQISHPNVCRVFDIGETKDGPFISMEFIDGEDLASLLKRIGRLPMDKGLQVAHQICTGLAAAHELGVVHRDLKPANIMLDGRGRVRITDFGLAALAEELREDKILAGTPAYMAPEQMSGGQVTPRTDIYAVGLLMYELFGGKQALPYSTASDLLRRRAALPLRLSKVVKDLDPGVERIIIRCLQVDPGERPSSAMEVAAALPGGDPLRAAIAAGETPSPDTVAAAGEAVTMSAGASIALLAAILLGIATSAYLMRYASVLGFAQGGKPPEALAERAREVIARFGYNENAADSAWWLEANRDGLAGLPRGSPEGMHFVYRQSPRPMIPKDYFGLVDTNDPPADVPGMIEVVLDARGRLREFSAVPVSADNHGPPPDWAVALSQASVGSPQIAPPNALVVPPTAYETRQDWRASDAGRTVAITAAAYGGRLVYFRAAPAPLPATARGRARGFAGIMFVVAAIVCGIGGSFLARRNMRRGRGDRQGAFRVAAFIFLAEFLGWVLSAHFVPAASEEYGAFIGGCGESLYVAGFMWVLYMAIEPYVRRRWPWMLISWTRVLSGGLYDPRIGRDVLFGAAGGAAMAMIQNGVNALPAWFPVANILPAVPSPLVLRGPASMLAALCTHASLAVQWALATVSFLLVARVVARRDWLAALVSGVSLGMVVLAADNFAVAITAAMLCSVIVYWLLFRFGLLSVAVTLFFYFLLRRWPLSLDFSQWFAWRSVFSISVLLAVAVFGFVAVNAGRPIFAESALDD
ncbi:MAG TPA: serine/threonine-protein kinase [Candidatus Acidoferrales bacterium]|nr:serine/threonine-protein kinase [Candidatus Acidoferrales bacterium]